MLSRFARQWRLRRKRLRLFGRLGIELMNISNELIEYKYLNMDNNKFYPTQVELINSVGKAGIIRTIPSKPEYNQVLIVAGQLPFTEVAAILICRKLCNL